MTSEEVIEYALVQAEELHVLAFSIGEWSQKKGGLVTWKDIHERSEAAIEGLETLLFWGEEERESGRGN